MTSNIVEQLLRGSAEIDRMKKEIGQIIQMLVGYLNQFDLVRPAKEKGFDANLELYFEKGVTRWIVARNASRDTVIIDLEIRPWDGIRKVYCNQWHQSTMPSSLDILGIHESLPILVEGLAKRYPQLQEAWKPLLQAAE